jgi:phenol/toluene 2-monooxygenase (NADH) P0/A0
VVVKPLKHYVHITSEKRTGFVEFNFSINDPSLFLEMILPVKAFDGFCKINDVTFLSPEEIQAVEQQQKKWNS